MKEKTVSLTPNIGIYAFFKRIAYTIPSALAELVDNSIDSFSENSIYLEGRKLKVEINYFDNLYYPEENQITVYDNAFGMNFNELAEALKLQRQSKHRKNAKRIGEYGFGLKCAATWFSNFWTVETTQKNSNEKYIVTIDVNKFVEKKDANVEIKTEVSDKSEHYTLIKLSCLNRNIGLSDFKKIKDEFKDLYGKRIYNQELEIFVSKIDQQKNKTKTWKIEAGDFGTNKTIAYNRDTDQYYSWNIKDEVETNNQNYQFAGEIHLAKNILEKPGLHLFKRERLIEICYPKHVFTNYNPRKRIYGKIFLSNNWPVSLTKDKISWEGELEEKFWKKIHIFLKKTRSEFHQKNIFSLADEIREPSISKTKKIPDILKKQLKNSNFFAIEESLFLNENQDVNQIQNQLSAKLPPIKLSFDNQAIKQKEKLEIHFNESKECNQIMKVIKTEDNGFPTVVLIFYLNHLFFQTFEKKVIKTEIKTLLIKLISGFIYSLSVSENRNLERVFKHLNKYLSK